MVHLRALRAGGLLCCLGFWASLCGVRRMLARRFVIGAGMRCRVFFLNKTTKYYLFLGFRWGGEGARAAEIRSTPLDIRPNLIREFLGVSRSRPINNGIAQPNPTSGLNRKIKSTLRCWSVLGRFPAKRGPRTPLNGPGSKNDAERAYNQPRK